MRYLKLSGLAVIVAVGAYAATLALVPPRKSAAGGRSGQLFSVEIMRLAKDSPAASYDAH